MSGFRGGAQEVLYSLTGVKEIQDMLAQFDDPILTQRSDRAVKKGAQVFAAPLAAAVTPLSKRMGRSVYVHKAKRGEKPAYVIGHHVRTAFFWHMVIGGTKAHSTAARDGHRTGPFVRGVHAHPIVEAVADAYADQAYAATVADLAKDT